jgi:hypothetical protein
MNKVPIRKESYIQFMFDRQWFFDISGSVFVVNSWFNDVKAYTFKQLRGI